MTVTVFVLVGEFIMGIRAGKLSSPDFLDKRGIDTSCVQASS